jgi:cytochrome c peroxidase
LRQLRSLGPWPPAFVPDPGNRVSGQPLAAELGRRLFNDPRMSPVGYVACVSCHQTDRAFTDRKARAHGLADLPRNTPTLLNVRLQRGFGWGGASDSLWLASLRPMLDAREFDSTPQVVARIYVRDESLAACYRAVFGYAPAEPAERTMVDTAKALAAYLETLLTPRSSFDDFRDALLRGDAVRAAAYPAAAQRGLKLFIGPLGCVACHAGPNFSAGGFHRAGAVQPARAQAVRELRASRFNLLGEHNDDPTRANEAITRRLLATPGRATAVRTPGLRGVAWTGPYRHDGRAEDLRHAAVHRWDDGLAKRPRPDAAQVDDLLAFLHSLGDTPWRPPESRDCP